MSPASKRIANPPALSTRAAGILLHPTSLPGPFGAGDLGPEAYRFADDLQQAGLRWWQMLPITPPGPAPEFSPYSAHSAFAGSPWLISPQMLHEQGLLSKRELSGARRPPGGRIDFARFFRFREPLLRSAYQNASRLPHNERQEFDRFCRENSHWLDDYALYSAIKQNQRGTSWIRWPVEIRLRRPAAVAAAQIQYRDEILFHKFVQWLFDRQWTALKDYCNRSGVGFIGDLPIFVSRDSDCVWARKDLFLLDSAGKPTVISGYPPDPFSKLGQLWGHPHYRWRAHAAEKFRWWIARFARTLQQFDAVRIDHFLGFHRVWAVPAGAKNAMNGKWLPVPGDALFAAVAQTLGCAAVIAEDLGQQTRQAIALRDKYRFPGMRVLQFAFGDDEYHRPHVFPKNCVAYTGTHDNQTLVGWFDNLKASANGELTRALEYVGETVRDSHWNFIRALFASVARTAIVPAQDVLGLGGEHRMNVPGVLRGNWGWRMSAPLPDAIIRRVRALGEATGRAPIQDQLQPTKEIQLHERKRKRGKARRRRSAAATS